MRWVLPILLVSLLTPVATAEESNACAEPCGFIVPIIDLQFPDKELCGGGRLIYADEAPLDCYPLLANGESLELTGVFRMYWDAQEEPTYPIDPNEPITVRFTETQSNPDWLTLSVEPASFEIGLTDLYDPARYSEVDAEGNPMIWYSYEEPITVTFTRTGDPSETWQEKMEDREGVLPTFLKARSTSSGAYYREAFGVEEFRFSACLTDEYAGDICGFEVNEAGEPVPTEQPDEDAPGLWIGAVMLALVGVAIRRRY